MGYYKGEVGIAAGAYHYVNKNLLLNSAVSYSKSSGASMRAGFTFGF